MAKKYQSHYCYVDLNKLSQIGELLYKILLQYTAKGFVILSIKFAVTLSNKQ